MMYSDLCCKIGFILTCVPLTLAPEKLFTLTLCFWNGRPGCKRETTESLAMHIVPFDQRQFSLLSDVTLSFTSVSLTQISQRMVHLCRLFLLNNLNILDIFQDFFFEIQ